MTLELLKLWRAFPNLMAEALEVATAKGIGRMEMEAVARVGETALIGATGLTKRGDAATAEIAVISKIEVAVEAWTEREAWTVNTQDPKAEAGAWIGMVHMNVVIDMTEVH